MKKKDARKQTRKELYQRRKQVIHLYKEKVPVMQIVKKCGLSWSAVNAAIKLYKSEGNEKALMPAARGRKQGAGRMLSREQEFEIHRLICSKRPYQCKLKSQYLWDKTLVMQLIEIKYEIKLSVRGLDKYLKRWGFVLGNQKNPYIRCSPVIKEWLDKNYSTIEQEAQEMNAHICWLNKTAVNYPFEILPGEKLQKLWMYTVVTNQIKRRKQGWLIFKDSFNSNNQVSLLKALIRSTRKKVFVISESSKINFSKDTINWIEKNPMITIFYEKPYQHNSKVHSTVQRKQGVSNEKNDLKEEMLELENWIFYINMY